jgi:thiol-disulfide isomerase/thioredoxin
MPAVESQMLPLGTQAPVFTLPDPDGSLYSLRDDAPATLVMFLSNHCPFVIHIREELARVGTEYDARGVAIYAINSNDVNTYPADHPLRMKEKAVAWGYTFPYLFDESQEAAKAYRAACTPDFFVFDAEQKLAYRGQLDDSRPSNSLPIDGHDLRAALDAVLASATPAAEQKPSIGCSIKWIAGNEPEYSLS